MNEGGGAGVPSPSSTLPIVNFSGIINLSDVLNQLPLPRPQPQSSFNSQILYDPSTVATVRDLLSRKDEDRVWQLAQALQATSVDYLKAGRIPGSSQVTGEQPALLQMLMQRAPNTFLPWQNRAPQMSKPVSVPDLIQSTQSTPGPSHLQPDIGMSGVPLNPPAAACATQRPISPVSHKERPIIIADRSPPAQLPDIHSSAHVPVYLLHAEPENLHQHVVTQDRILQVEVVRETYTEHQRHQPSSSSRQPPPPALAKVSTDKSAVPKTEYEIFQAIQAGEYTVDLTERVKGRRRGAKQTDYEELGADVIEAVPSDDERDESFQPSAKSGSKLSESTHDLVPPLVVKTKRLAAPREYVAPEDSSSYKQFVSLADSIVQGVGERNLAALNEREDKDDAKTARHIPSEVLIETSAIQRLARLAQQLKQLNATRLVPTVTLVKLLNVLVWNVRDGATVRALPAQVVDESGELAWRERDCERVQHSLESALAALYVITAPDLPRDAALDDVFHYSIVATKFHLVNTIYPAFDVNYRYGGSDKPSGKGKQKTKSKTKTLTLLYNSATELVSLLADLVERHILSEQDRSILCTISASPFFVENIPDLQLTSLRLVCAVFSRFEDCQKDVIDIFANSLLKLPSSKKIVRAYRLSSNASIQMVCALVMQLIHCLSKPPQLIAEGEESTADDEAVAKKAVNKMTQVTLNLLNCFVQKCSAKHGEEDHRTLLENFIQDLLATLNRPEWPASRFILEILAQMLIRQISDKAIDANVRTSSVDFLNSIASAIYQTAAAEAKEYESIEEIVMRLREAAGADTSLKREQLLQGAIAQHLANSGHADEIWLRSARDFYLTLWFRQQSDCLEQDMRELKEKEDVSEKKLQKSTAKLLSKAEKRKDFIRGLQQLKAIAADLPASLNYEDATLICRRLMSHQTVTLQNYLVVIVKLIHEQSTHLRTKAMKCLSILVEAEPMLLSKEIVRNAVAECLTESSALLREASLDLIGKFIANDLQLVEHYLPMLKKQLSDAAVSVRKRCIRILRDICLAQREHPLLNPLSMMMLNRINDEDSIKKLVIDAFQQLWFQPLGGSDHTALKKRVVSITTVVKDSGTSPDWFHELLSALLKDSSTKALTHTASKEIVNCLIDTMVTDTDTSSDEANRTAYVQRHYPCFITLRLFADEIPELLVPHIDTMQPYINSKVQNVADYRRLVAVMRILEQSVPLMEEFNFKLLALIEEELVRVVYKLGVPVLEGAINCLSAVVNSRTHHHQLVVDLFGNFYSQMNSFWREHVRNPSNPELMKLKPRFLRSLYVVGLICRNFDLETLKYDDAVSVMETIYKTYIHFCSVDLVDVKRNALKGIGFICIQYKEYLLKPELKTLYNQLLKDKNVSPDLKVDVITNILNFLQADQAKCSIIQEETSAAEALDKADLKQGNDQESSHTSIVALAYLSSLVTCNLHTAARVRFVALNCICKILDRNLVGPVQCVPSLIASLTDHETQIYNKAEKQLLEIDRRYPGAVNSKAQQGVDLSWQMQRVAQADQFEPLLRGVRGSDSCLLAPLFTILRRVKEQRRAFVQRIIDRFDDPKYKLSQLLYLADQLVFFPYQQLEEGIHVAFAIDKRISVTGTHVIDKFKEKLTCPPETELDTAVVVETYLPRDIAPLVALMGETTRAAHLLLRVKTALKEMYGFTEAKIRSYGETSGKEHTKLFDKPLQRKFVFRFTPTETLSYLRNPNQLEDSAGGRSKLAATFIQLKTLLEAVDRDDDEVTEDGPLTFCTETVVAEMNEGESAEAGGDGVPKIKVIIRRGGGATADKQKVGTPARKRARPAAATTSSKKKKQQKKRRRKDWDSDDDENEEVSEPEYDD